jgi:hypothetical protein
MKSELAYERYAHGEVPASPTSEELLKMDELVRADGDFLKAHPAEAFFKDLDRKRRRKAFARWRVLGPALAACAAIAIAGLANLPRFDAPRTKGSDLNIFAYHRTEGGTEILGRDTKLSAGDEIQIAYYARGKVFAAILSLDGRGKVTRHMPLHGPESLAIDTRDFALLPYSYKLDDAPRFEDLYFIVSPRPFKIDELLPFLTAGFDNGEPSILLPSPFRYATLRVKKSEAEK